LTQRHYAAVTVEYVLASWRRATHRHPAVVAGKIPTRPGSGRSRSIR